MNINVKTDNFVPEMAGMLLTKQQITDFIFAGKAIFTIKNIETQNRFTFRLVRKEGDDKTILHFVQVLTGSDNETSYSFFGTIFDGKRFSLSAKSKVPCKKRNPNEEDAPSIVAFQWFFNRLFSNKEFPSNCEIWHEGVCGCCGRKLTVPESIERGLGPVCDKRVSANRMFNF